MKRVVVRLALDEDADVVQVLGAAVTHIKTLHGAMVVGGDSSQILAAADSDEEGRRIAEFLSAPDGEGFTLTEEGTL